MFSGTLTLEKPESVAKEMNESKYTTSCVRLRTYQRNPIKILEEKKEKHTHIASCQTHGMILFHIRHT